MTKDKNNKKIIQDVQDTGDEAGRLLADLEAESNGKVTSQFELDAYRKKKANNSPSTHSGHRSFQSSRVIKEQEPNSGNPAVAIGVLAFFVFIAVVASVSQPSEEVTSTSSDLNSEDSSSSFVKKEKPLMTASQKSFFNKTLVKAKQAVLKSEHKYAISSLELLKRGQYKDLLGIDIGLVNNKIIQAQKQLKFLDQPGDFDYRETSTYGSQWFDKQADNHFKLFFAYSRKCKNPLITFNYFPRNSEKVVKTYTKKPIANISTIYVPYYGENSISIQGFRCN